jgi:hypothetical protein
MLIYKDEVNILELKKQRAEWEEIEREAILRRFNLNIS